MFFYLAKFDLTKGRSWVTTRADQVPGFPVGCTAAEVFRRKTRQSLPERWPPRPAAIEVLAGRRCSSRSGSSGCQPGRRVQELVVMDLCFAGHGSN